MWVVLMAEAMATHWRVVLDRSRCNPGAWCAHRLREAIAGGVEGRMARLSAGARRRYRVARPSGALMPCHSQEYLGGHG